MAQDRKHRAELRDVEARLAAGEKLLAEQAARIDWLRKRSLDTATALHLLEQLQYSMILLTATSDLIHREMDGNKAPGLRIGAWHRFADGDGGSSDRRVNPR